MKTLLLALMFFLVIPLLKAGNGYELWLNFQKIEDETYRSQLLKHIGSIAINNSSETITIAQKELKLGLEKLLGKEIPIKNHLAKKTLYVANYNNLPKSIRAALKQKIQKINKDGFLIQSIISKNQHNIIITASQDAGVLYGAFHFLRLIQNLQPIENLDISESPQYRLRMLNHWDNMNGSVERGYAGKSIWKWDKLPAEIDKRYADYARANASIGINGTVLNNVNASPDFLESHFLPKVAAIANVLRPYGIKVFLAVNFASPIIIDNLETADPLHPEVKKWWQEKAAEIYRLIPDFGGFIVKANSEGQPGPQDYNRSHADGANMMAAALKPFDGILIWRAFVYNGGHGDGVTHPYNEFVPLDGQFDENVLLQIKNGPLDFQPREPFSPLFGAMPHTAQMPEFQLTQEYLGFSTHLVYLAPLIKETLDADTYANGKGSTVQKITDGSLYNHALNGIAAVANIGESINWTGHPFAQVNWYAFGRLSWNAQLTAEEIAKEWTQMTLTRHQPSIKLIVKMMMASREAAVHYMMPLGLNTLSAVGHHYGPQPWRRRNFHHADSLGIGFDRTSTGSNAVAQYQQPLWDSFENLQTCPENLLAWFHHVPWNYIMKSGKTFWEELCYKYYEGVDEVRQMRKSWNSVKANVDSSIFTQVKRLLQTQEEEAVWWRDACVLYFAGFSGMEIPQGLERPVYTWEMIKKRESENKNLKHYN